MRLMKPDDEHCPMSSHRESRLNAVRNAIIEGKPSPRVQELLQAYIDGHITATEMRDAIMEHARRSAM
jgi:antitoxin VbhA-like protein